MVISIKKKIEQLDTLAEKIESCEEDFIEIHEVKRELLLFVKYNFEQDKFYLDEINKIDLPDIEDEAANPEKARIQLDKSIMKLLDMTDTLKEDLRIGKGRGKSKKETNIEKKFSNRIFIVHGRDHKPVKDLRKIILNVGLEPIILHEQAGGSRTIIEKLEKYSDVGYAFVILTPDDVGGLFRGTKGYLLTHSKLALRARQNVILEFGYFIGKLGRDNVCCLLKESVEKPSDMGGISYLDFNESVEEVKGKIISELRQAGYRIRKIKSI